MQGCGREFCKQLVHGADNGKPVQHSLEHTRSKDSQVPGMFPKEFPIAPHFIPYALANVVLL